MIGMESQLFVVLFIVYFAVVSLLSWAAYKHTEAGFKRYISAGILYPWFLLIVFFGTQGGFTNFSQFPPNVAVAISFPPIVALLLLRSSWLQEVVRKIPHRLIIGIQAYRIIGSIFFLTLIQKTLPLVFALPTGILDTLIGFAAPFVAEQYVKKGNTNVALLWNIIGLADFAYSVTLGLISAPTIIQLVKLSPGPEALGTMPLAIITSFGVPLSIILHMFSLAKLSWEGKQKPALL
jgi:hypothetical protein